MNTTNRLNHAYSQAPWRVQRQWVSVFLLIVLGFAMIATLYLMVTSQAAITGREIQNLRQAIIETDNTNADLQYRGRTTGVYAWVPAGKTGRYGISICAWLCST
jgi:Tfp pilus assembly protein PilN